MFPFPGKILRSARRRRLPGALGHGLEQISQRRAGAKQARADGVQGEFEKVGNFRVAKLLEFTKEEDFAVDGIEFFDRAADPQSGFGGILPGGIGNRHFLNEKRGAKSGLAAVRAQDLEAHGIEIGAEEGAGLVAGGGAEEGEKSLLGQLFRVGGFENTAAEKPENG